MQAGLIFQSGRSVILGVFMGLVPLFSAAQSFDWRSRIDRLVQQADSLSFERQYTFYLHKFDRNHKSFREIWHYSTADNNVLLFEVHHFRDSLEILETYYLDGRKLICMEQYEILYPQEGDDILFNGGVYFFREEVLSQQVHMGRGEDSKYRRDGGELVKKFRIRYKELSQNRGLIEPKRPNPLF